MPRTIKIDYVFAILNGNVIWKHSDTSTASGHKVMLKIKILFFRIMDFFYFSRHLRAGNTWTIFSAF